MKSLGKDWRGWLADLLGVHPEDRNALTEMLRDLAGKGSFVTPQEMKMIEGVLRMRELKIRDVMIPKTDMVSMKISDDYQQAVERVREWQHSRYPVVDGDNREKVLGILLAKDLLGYTDRPGQFKMNEVMREAVFEPDSKPLDHLLEDFRSQRSHMVIVRDEYAEVAGIITIEDLLERIVGEIEDESDEKEDREIYRAEDGDHVKGSVSVEEFNAYFNSDIPANGVDSIAGWLAAALGHLPRAGDRHEAHGLIFNVTRADQRRVHTIVVTRRAE